jgi:hypothetical protein
VTALGRYIAEHEVPLGAKSGMSKMCSKKDIRKLLKQFHG